jgi:TonB family protein
MEPAGDLLAAGEKFVVGNTVSFAEVAVGLLAAGFFARLLWLGLGLYRLRRYRRESELLLTLPAPVTQMQDQLGIQAGFYVSDELKAPVTFGWKRPVVLVPRRFLELEPGLQQAIACHELLHVRRGDWVFTVIEELVRAALWFHPAVWWLLGQLQLSREQAVDLEVVRLTQAREPYVKSLLLMAGAAASLDLAPAPLFLRKRHLDRRIASVLRKEISMSKLRWLGSFAAMSALLVAAFWSAISWFPMQAAPQEAAEGIDYPVGVIEQGGEKLLYGARVPYPQASLEKRISGRVVLELSLDEKGSVYDAVVVSGPPELRRAALQSALQWQYSKDLTLPTKLAVTIRFQLPERTPKTLTAVLGENLGVLQQIDTAGVPAKVSNDLLAKLPVKIGDQVSRQDMVTIGRVLGENYDHLAMSWQLAGEAVHLQIRLQDNMFTKGGEADKEPPAITYAQAQRIRIGGALQAKKVFHQTRPEYPAEAKRTGVQGIVQLKAVIGMEGNVMSLEAVSGPPVLVKPSLEAVRQWKYRPTFLNGNPVEVESTIDVNYTLSR